MSMFRVAGRCAMAMCMLGVSACSAGPAYTPPEPDVSSSWSALNGMRGGINVHEDAAQESWWQVFRDPQLDRLVIQALANNHDLAAAQARVDAADAEAGTVRANLMPRLDGSASAARGRAGPAKDDLDSTTRIGVQGSWDIDPAGGNRRRLEAALAEADAARADRDRIRADLIADVSLNYIGLLGARRQLALTQLNLNDQDQNLRITQGQREQGAVSDLELSRAKAQAETTRARLPDLHTQITGYINQLGVLTGAKPGVLDTTLHLQRAIPAVPAEVVVSTPISTVRQRPDIRLSERRLARAAALHAAAVAQIYPSLSLSAFYGQEDSLNVGHFTPWNIAASSLMPLIDFGRIRRQIEASDARSREALHNYQQAVLKGLAEVEDALAAYSNEQTRQVSLSAAAQHEGQAAHIASEQYKAGATGQIDLLLAQDKKLEADLTLAASQQALAEDLVKLFRALGWGALADALQYNETISPAPVLDLKTAPMRHRPASRGMRPIVDH